MKKGEILTDAALYVADIPEEYAGDVVEAWKYVKDCIAAGMPLEGIAIDNRLHEKPPLSIFSIEDGAQVKHIRIYDDQDHSSMVAPPTGDDVEQPEEPTGFYKFRTDLATFLGQKFKVLGAAYHEEGHTYYLPMEIDDGGPQLPKPAQEVLSEKNLADFIHYWKQSQGSDGTGYTVIVPPGQLPDYEEAAAYIQDYVPKDKNAKAWQGWKNEK